jgi:hypothetical protein
MNTPTLSTGQPSTLGNYHDLCEAVGFTKAQSYFEEKIYAQGRDEPVLADERQMILLILSLESGN